MNAPIVLMKFWDKLQNIFGASSEKIRIYKELVRHERGDKILDFGCATGNTATAFLNANYLGVDIDRGAISWAKQKYSDLKYSNLKFLCANAFEIQHSGYDHIVVACTGHHLNDSDLITVLDRLLLLLNRNGKLYFIDNDKSVNDSLVVKLMHSIDQGRYMRGSDEYEMLFKQINNGEIIRREFSIEANSFFDYKFLCFDFIKK